MQHPPRRWLGAQLAKHAVARLFQPLHLEPPERRPRREQQQRHAQADAQADAHPPRHAVGAAAAVAVGAFCGRTMLATWDGAGRSAALRASRCSNLRHRRLLIGRGGRGGCGFGD
eukprot:364483-Chlamydomonas_euryale.AAC.8